MDWKGSVAIVTGASRDIGEATATLTLASVTEHPG
jgi:NAD(P)-dependent dehydrogenase (short-subunit alcohol dehydrogenase family)